jgi:hypothetical protein
VHGLNDATFAGSYAFRNCQLAFLELVVEIELNISAEKCTSALPFLACISGLWRQYTWQVCVPSSCARLCDLQLRFLQCLCEDTADSGMLRMTISDLGWMHDCLVALSFGLPSRIQSGLSWASTLEILRCHLEADKRSLLVLASIYSS